MTMYESSDIRKGLKVVLKGDPYTVVDFEFVKPGKGNAFTRTRMKNMRNGNVVDMTFRSGEKFEKADLEERQMQFLYSDADSYTFMDTQTYDQIALQNETVGEAKNYLKENTVCAVLLFNGEPLGVEVPNFVDLLVTKSDPGVKGDTSSGAQKPATLETGFTVMVPLFVNEGDYLKVDTRDGTYVERSKLK
jgi:elongation factor P